MVESKRSNDSSDSVPFQSQSSLSAPTPVNTPLNPAPIASRLSRPTVADIDEDDDEDVSNENIGRSDQATQGAINALMREKLAGLIGKSSGYIESLPVPVKRRVEGLKGQTRQLLELQMQHKKEMYVLEKKYLELTQPLYKRRLEIVHGVSEPTAEELAAGREQSLKDDPEAEPIPANDDTAAGDSATKGVPEFWLTALRNHVAFSNLITERDEKAMEHLTNISLSYLDGETSGYRLTFHFSPNEFFANETLTKEYHYKDELDLEGDYMYEKAIGCTIQWKEEQNLTQEIEVKRQRNKATNRTRIVRRAKAADSFFNFFTPPKPIGDDEEDNMEDDEFEEAQENLEMDYQLGQDLKDRVIPRAVDYFTGKALEWEDDEDDEDGFDEYDDDEDEDGDDDSDDDVPAPRRQGPKKTTAAEGDEQCKQQ